MVVAAVLTALTAGCGDDETPAGTAGEAPVVTTIGEPSTTSCSSSADETRVPVVVAAEDSAAGTTAAEAIASGALAEQTIQWGFRPPTAVESLDDLAGGVAIADLLANQVVLVTHWGLPPDMTVASPPGGPPCPD